MDQYGSGICVNAFDASPIKVFEPEWNMQKFFSESVLLRRLNIDGVIYGFGGFPLVIREKWSIILNILPWRNIRLKRK